MSVLSRYALRRVIHTAILLVLVSALCFLMVRLAPGTALIDLRLNPQISPQTIETLERRYGAGQPLLVQYTSWLAGAVRGRLGFSVVYQRPAAELLLPRAARTIALSSAALLLTWLIAVPLGLFCAARPGTLLERVSRHAASALLSIPELLLALGLLYLAARFRILPLAGSIWPPLIVLTAAAFPVVYRHVFSAARDAAASTAVRAARAHGILGFRLWTVYVLPLAANPLLSLLGSMLGALAGASLLVEWIFSWPGLGPLFLEAIASRDLDLLTGIELLAAAFLAAGNLFADFLLFACDPRIRTDAS